MRHHPVSSLELVCGCTLSVGEIGAEDPLHHSVICPNHWPDLPTAWQVTRRTSTTAGRHRTPEAAPRADTHPRRRIASPQHPEPTRRGSSPITIRYVS